MEIYHLRGNNVFISVRINKTQNKIYMERKSFLVTSLVIQIKTLDRQIWNTKVRDNHPKHRRQKTSSFRDTKLGGRHITFPISRPRGRANNNNKKRQPGQKERKAGTSLRRKRPREARNLRFGFWFDAPCKHLTFTPGLLVTVVG